MTMDYRFRRLATIAGMLTMLLAGLRPLGAVPTNLAPAGVASASSAYAGDEATYGAAHANNGNRAGNDIWHSTNSDTVTAWWQVDLGSEYYLDRVQIFPRALSQGTVGNFRIEVLDASNSVVFSQTFLPTSATDRDMRDDTPYNRDLGQYDLTGPSIWATNALRNVRGKTVRIERNSPGNTTNETAMTFGEFEVYGQSTPIIENLALGRPVTATPPLTGYEAWADIQPANGNDGNLDGSFYHGSVYHSDPSITPFAGHFWQVELAAASEIDYVTFYARGDYVANHGFLKLSVLDANGVLVPGTEQELDLTPGNTFDLTHDFATNPTGKFVRIETLSENILELTELEVFGFSSAVPVPGDFDGDGDADGADFVAWQTNFPKASGASRSQGDADGDMDVDGADFAAWQDRFPTGVAVGASPVPEPATAILALGLLGLCLPVRMKRRAKAFEN